ncbi:hypothetical protein B0H14DRAFT_2755819 [Mycena olivaceomarginata]|nr:hypothetical protein B0H14DRAFT_2755819 [Mycena olivaceomarginata]
MRGGCTRWVSRIWFLVSFWENLERGDARGHSRCGFGGAMGCDLVLYRAPYSTCEPCIHARIEARPPHTSTPCRWSLRHSPTQLADPRSTSKTSSPTSLLHSLHPHNDVKLDRGRQTPSRGGHVDLLGRARGRVGTVRARCVHEHGVGTGRASTPSLHSIPEYQLPGLQRFKG